MEGIQEGLIIKIDWSQRKGSAPILGSVMPFSVDLPPSLFLSSCIFIMTLTSYHQYLAALFSITGPNSVSTHRFRSISSGRMSLAQVFMVNPVNAPGDDYITSGI